MGDVYAGQGGQPVRQFGHGGLASVEIAGGAGAEGIVAVVVRDRGGAVLRLDHRQQRFAFGIRKKIAKNEEVEPRGGEALHAGMREQDVRR
jgi:hypothetical protein